MKKKKMYAAGGALALLSVVFTVMVTMIDVQPIGALGTDVGFAGVNGFFAELIGTNMLWYDITEVFGIIAILTAGVFAAVGLAQLLIGKSFKAVNRSIYALGGTYVIVMILYVAFERLALNYRPILMPGCTEVEASFPSSHTMLIIAVMGTAVIALALLMKNKALCRALQIICAIIIVLTVFGRMLSGVHWFTDIVGGALIGATVVTLYGAAVCKK